MEPNKHTQTTHQYRQHTFTIQNIRLKSHTKLANNWQSSYIQHVDVIYFRSNRIQVLPVLLKIFFPRAAFVYFVLVCSWLCITKCGSLTKETNNVPHNIQPNSTELGTCTWCPDLASLRPRLTTNLNTGAWSSQHAVPAHTEQHFGVPFANTSTMTHETNTHFTNILPIASCRSCCSCLCFAKA